ncbi:MAG: nucleotidyl transferase AbiEii/AbiGii toxin family protein [Bacteroidetes bacterium]|nr:nucleotidyl transferase AbiEii/AbiGii toxin family protein [Bacteroidota bacterium]
MAFHKTIHSKLLLVGGTAIALHIGHRTSIDFDLFTPLAINRTIIKKAVSKSVYKSYIIVEKADQIHFVVNDVKLTFFNFHLILMQQYFINNILEFQNC